MARHLVNMGHDVTVVTTDAAGASESDAGVRVVRAGDLRSSRLLRRALGRGAPIGEDPGAHLETPTTELLTKVLVPDALVLAWLPTAFRATRSLITSHPFDCLVTTSPPETAHLIGLLLGRRRPAWVADFRDGWTFEPIRPSFPTRVQRKLDSRLERAVVTSADAVVGVTRPIAADLGRRLHGRTFHVPNGWDPDSAALVDTTMCHPSETDTVTLLHTGSLSGLWGRDPLPLFQALTRLAAEPGERPVRLVQAGPLTSDERQLIESCGASSVVEHVGILDRDQALALQRSADVLLLLTSPNPSEATSKVFEYLAAGKPILALAHGNEAARIVEETRSGLTVPPDDVDKIARALRDASSGALSAMHRPRDLERYVYPGPAVELSGVIEQAIVHHGHLTT